jgi:peroxidase
MHSACLPITISKNDPFYSQHEIKCMGLVRSYLISNNPNQLEIGEQVNTVTSFLDHSNIYGSSQKIARRVRSFNGGRLKTNLRNILHMENGNYFSGDERVVQTPFIAIWHSLFVRNHNNLADKLAVLNRHWDGNQVFNEARRINIAIYQKIVYSEWLPAFLGVQYAKRYENSSYDSNLDPSTLNEFSSAAFRFMHSFIGSDFEILNKNFDAVRVNVSDAISNAKLLENTFDGVLRGLMNQKINIDGYSNEVLNKLYKNDKDVGMDLLSIDILRGRDHGIAPYIKYRDLCNMKSNIKVFDDLRPYIPDEAITQLRKTYKSVLDIDLIVGGALESIFPNATDDDSLGFFGPTFQCIIDEEFRRLKAGDSHFYSHEGNFERGID